MPTSGIRIVAEKNLGSFLASAKATINNSAVVTYSGGLSPSTSPPPAYTQAELDILGAPVTLDNVMILENIQPQQEAASLDSKSSRKTFVNLDSKAWHGGFSTIVSPTTDSAAAAAGSNTTAAAATTETPVFAELQTNNMIRSGRGRGGGGRRAARDIKQEQLSPEEEQRLRLRRERNKEAAARCRKRRVDQTEALQAQVRKYVHMFMFYNSFMFAIELLYLHNKLVSTPMLFKFGIINITDLFPVPHSLTYLPHVRPITDPSSIALHSLGFP